MKYSFYPSVFWIIVSVFGTTLTVQADSSATLSGDDLAPIHYNSTFAPPERIYPMARKQMSVDYYLEQGQLWKQELANHPKNALGWFNYYKAARYANQLTQNEVKPFDLNEIYEQAIQVIPLTFEAHYLTYLQNSWTEEGFAALLKAHYLAPKRYEAYHSLINYYEYKGDRNGVKDINQKWYDSGTYSAGILHWNYNLLMSLEDNAVVITAGDNDTYPVWLLQDIKGIRKDIRAINIHMLANLPEYRTLIIKELGIKEAFVNKVGNQKSAEEILTFLLEKCNRPIYLDITNRQYLKRAFEDDLYLTGLAFKMSKKSFDNVAVLKNNYENRFMTDYLHINLQNDTSISVVNRINENYIPPFITLYEHYTASGEVQKAKDIKQLTLNIAKPADRLESVQAYFAENTDEDPVKSIINYKKLEKSIVPVQNGLYAGITEVSNEQYEAFLVDLVKNRRFDLLEKCQPQTTDWRTLLPTGYKNLDDKIVFHHAHPDDADAPIQNISHEAAVAYCEWITNVYNQTENNRKRFQKVKFRLPTESEWTTAANGGLNQGLYAWGAYYYKNEDGCYLANFAVDNEEPCDNCDLKSGQTSKDGGFFTVPVTSYLSNNFEMHNATGNVAEMIDEAGIAKGGSWEDKPEDSTLTARKKYGERSPAVGFRVFMEVED